MINSTSIVHSEEKVVLVDDFDNEIGTMEKLLAHEKGALHRAVSVFIFNDLGQMLLQQRAVSKYHSGGLWTNTCCSHPRLGELPLEAAHRRLFEEMGMSCHLEKVLDFTYKVVLDKNLTEHEFDHVFFGRSNQHPCLNPAEAIDWKWIDVDVLEKDVAKNPQKYTAWFKIILKKIRFSIYHSTVPAP